MARIDALLRAARARLQPDGDASGEAAHLLAHVLGHGTGWLYAHGDDEADADAQARFDALVQRRVAGEPVAYLTGLRGFWRFDLQVTPDTLIPRPETERLVELALERLPADAPARVADLGTGSGAIALALAFERPYAQVLATDASDAALAVARGNAQRLALANIAFAHGDWYVPLQSALLQDAPLHFARLQSAPPHGERFDLIASNPPYIEADDPHLGQGDLRFEPRSALASGGDGLDAIRAIAAGAIAHLAPGGWLLVEHGWRQGAAVRALFEAAGLREVHTAQDLERRDRVTLGRAPGG